MQSNAYNASMSAGNIADDRYVADLSSMGLVDAELLYYIKQSYKSKCLSCKCSENLSGISINATFINMRVFIVIVQ